MDDSQANRFVSKDSDRDLEIYSRSFLSIYDYFVLGLVCPVMWGCSKNKILELYNNYVSSSHLDIGVGTGYFLDQCQPKEKPQITLVDLNQNCLNHTAARIDRYQPECVRADIYKPLPLKQKYSSVAINLLLHCLPGTIYDKEKILENIVPHLEDHAVVFGATVLGKNIQRHFIAKQLLKIYNRHGIFCNSEDDLAGLSNILKMHFQDVHISVQGCMALFVCRHRIKLID